MAEPPVPFERGMPIAASRLNALQLAILRALAAHDHSGDTQGPPLQAAGLANGAVTAPKLADGAVTSRALADRAVGAAALADGAVAAPALAPGAVGTAALAEGAVTEAKLSEAVLRLIRTRGDQVSSASQVVWRDPLVVMQPPLETHAPVGILATFVEPERVFWPPPVIALDPEGQPVQLKPGTGGASLEVIAYREDDARSDALYRTLDERVVRTANDIGVLGALRTDPDRTAGAARTATRADAAAGSGADPGATATATFAFTEAGARMAHRMTAITSLDAAGRATAYSGDTATFAPAFDGKESFLEGGGAVSYKALQTSEEKARAARGLRATLYNLGFDADYIAAADEPIQLTDALSLALAADPGFFAADNPLWQSGGWLPEVLERPELFGTGYAISGGRNVLDVTRHPGPDGGAGWVRVRFVTPYRDAAYAVTVTPALRSDHALIAAMIRNKRRDSVEIVFRGLRADGGDIVTLDKVSFDLAVFGELERG